MWSAARLTESIATSRSPAKWNTEKLPSSALPRTTLRVALKEQPDHLQLDVALVRPEPRHLAIGLALAEQRLRRGLALVDGVLHRFEPDPPAEFPMVERDAVADRDDVRRAGRHAFVDEDAVVDGEAGAFGELDIRDDADADHARCRPGCARRSAVSTATTRPPSPTIRPTGVPSRTSLPQPRWSGEEMARDFRRDDPAHQPVGGFEHRHRLAEKPRRAGDLEADEAAADHHHVLRRMQPLAKLPRVGSRRGARRRRRGRSRRSAAGAAARRCASASASKGSVSPSCERDRSLPRIDRDRLRRRA